MELSTYIAVDLNGIEAIFDNLPKRDEKEWVAGFMCHFIIVPKGTSKLLSGKQMTWEDEPYLLQETV